VERLFGGVDSGTVPLLLTVAIGVVLPVDEFLAGEPEAAIIQTATWLLIGIPLSTAVWVYVILQLGLNRLGRRRMTMPAYRGDRTLGMQPVGSLAFTGFWMLVGAVTPLILTGVSDLRSVLVGILVLTAGVALFFLSLRGLHSQMAMVKRQEVDLATCTNRHTSPCMTSRPLRSCSSRSVC
jgi:hypothetical protein